MLIVTDCRTNLADALHERVIGHESAGPDCLDQFLLRHEPTGVLGEVAQHIERFRAKLQFRSVAQQRAALQIERVLVEAEALWGNGIHPRRTSAAALRPHSNSFTKTSAKYHRGFV